MISDDLSEGHWKRKNTQSINGCIYPLDPNADVALGPQVYKKTEIFIGRLF